MKLKLKKSISLFLGVVLSSTLMAQTSYINKEWNMSNGNTSNEHENISCALDPNGNLVYIGSHVNNGNSDIFLNCIHPNGNVAWQQTCPSSATQDDWGTDLKIDANGNIYVCGVHHNGNSNGT